jgi:hypothetical protein
MYRAIFQRAHQPETMIHFGESHANLDELDVPRVLSRCVNNVRYGGRGGRAFLGVSEGQECGRNLGKKSAADSSSHDLFKCFNSLIQFIDE